MDRPVTKEEVAIMLEIPENQIRSFGPYAPSHPKYPGATVTYIENRTWKKVRYSRQDFKKTVDDMKMVITAKEAEALENEIERLKAELEKKTPPAPAVEETPVDPFELPEAAVGHSEDDEPAEEPKKKKKRKKQEA